MRLANLSAVAVVAALASLAAAVPASYFIDKPDVCMASVHTPKKPRPIEFCYSAKKESCCTPANDLAAKEAYFGVMANGAGCSPSDHDVRATYREIREFFCLPCDPLEPTYRFRARDGDAVTPGDPSAADDAFVWRICSSWLYGTDDRKGLWGADGSKFDDCGVTLPAPCEDVAPVSYNAATNAWVTGDPMPAVNVDCGTETIFPRVEYGVDLDPYNASQTFLAALPQWIPGFQFQVVNDTDPSFNFTATPCFKAAAAGRSAVLLAVVAALLMSIAASAL